jgi:DNA-binding XRE family transcriptional regulator
MPPKRLGPLGLLSCGERLITDRRRRKETQASAAKRLDTTPFIYGRWERDDDDGPSIRSVRPLQMYERCLLYRRRAGTSQEKVARQLGRSRWWINKMERGLVPCEELLSYWEK